MINVNALKPGMTFQEQKEIFVVVSTQHSKQGRGQAIVKIKMKNLRTKAVLIKSYTSGDKLELARIEKTKMSYLYSNKDNIVLMDKSTFNQIEVPVEKIKWELNFLTKETTLQVKMFNQEITGIELPSSMELLVTEAPDAVKGNTQNNSQKKIVLETGFIVEAPIFIKTGEKILVSTEDGKYLGRGK